MIAGALSSAVPRLQLPSVPLPKDWPETVQNAILHAIALGRFVISYTRSWALNSCVERIRLAAQLERSSAEVTMLIEENRLLRARIIKMPCARRPHYCPVDRFAILELKAARGWSAAQAARRLVLSPGTLASWLKRLDASGKESLLALPTPVNKFPEMLAQLVQRLKATLPFLGRRRIADMLARAGLHLSASTVKRLLERDWPDSAEPGDSGSSDAPQKTEAASVDSESADSEPPRTVVARYADHVWGIDLTVIPIMEGFWLPWLPRALRQSWPFAWWLAVVVDYHSRKVLFAQLFVSQPSAKQVCDCLDLAVAVNGCAPKYLVSDQGSQFRGEDYLDWCGARSVEPRYGALHRYGSISIVERLIRTLKEDGFRRILVPLSLKAMQEELRALVLWYNEFRPHSAHQGATPHEVHEVLSPARDGPRFEPRPNYPASGKVGARVPSEIRGVRGVSLHLVVDYVEGKKHLPIVSLRAA